MDRVEFDLRRSVNEESEAIKVYKERANKADPQTARLYTEVTRDESEHKEEFTKRLREVVMPTKKDRLIKECILKELDGDPMPKGQGQKARFERCVLKVKCTNKVEGHPKKYNPWSICHASVV